MSQPLNVLLTRSTEDSRSIFLHTKIPACHEGPRLLHVWPPLLLSMFCCHRRPLLVACLLEVVTSSALVSLHSAFTFFGTGLTSMFFLPASFFNLGWIVAVCRPGATSFDVLPRPPRRLLLLRLGWDEQRGRGA